MIIQVPPSALKELQQLEESDWSVSAQDLVDWVNFTADRFLPVDMEAKSGRVSDSLSLRTMRHYQTLGCIDPPVRDGREARYGFRHYLQTLLVRKLLWQRVPAETIATLLPSRTLQEYKELLLEGIELAAKTSSGKTAPAPALTSENWRRIAIADGIELHLRQEAAGLSKSSLPELLEKLKAALRNHFSAKRQPNRSSSRP